MNNLLIATHIIAELNNDMALLVSPSTPHSIGSLNTYIAFWVELDEKLFPLETQFSDLSPREGVDFCIALEDQYSHVCHG